MAVGHSRSVKCAVLRAQGEARHVYEAQRGAGHGCYCGFACPGIVCRGIKHKTCAQRKTRDVCSISRHVCEA